MTSPTDKRRQECPDCTVDGCKTPEVCVAEAEEYAKKYRAQSATRGMYTLREGFIFDQDGKYVRLGDVVDMLNALPSHGAACESCGVPDGLGHSDRCQLQAAAQSHERATNNAAPEPNKGSSTGSPVPCAHNGAAPSSTERRFPICKDHTDADWNQPTLDDESCVLCRLFYLEAQEGLLEEWQQRALKAEDAINDMQRPLDAQMARLNATVERLNGENEQLRAKLSASGPINEAGAALTKHNNGIAAVLRGMKRSRPQGER